MPKSASQGDLAPTGLVVEPCSPDHIGADTWNWFVSIGCPAHRRPTTGLPVNGWGRNVLIGSVRGTQIALGLVRRRPLFCSVVARHVAL